MKIVLCLALAVVCSVASAQAPDIEKDFLRIGVYMVAVMPPQAVCDGDVKKLCFSADGRFIYAIRKEDRLETKDVEEILKTGIVSNSDARGTDILVSWDVRARKLSELYRISRRFGEIRDLVPYSDGSDICFSTLLKRNELEGEPAQSFMLAWASPVEVKVLANGGFPSDGQVFTNPFGSMIAVAWTPPGVADQPLHSTTVQFFGPRGLPMRRITLDPPVIPWPYWSKKGIVSFVTDLNGLSATDPLLVSYDLDLQTGTLTGNKNFPESFRRIRGSRDVWKPILARKANGVESLWITQSPDSAVSVLLSDKWSELAKLSPTLDGVVYPEHGIAYYRPFVKVTDAGYEAGLSKRKHEPACLSAQRAFKVLLDYARQHHGIFPSSKTEATALFDLSLMKVDPTVTGFVYTFAGGRLPSTDLHKTVVGYLPFDGGKAYVYADGHASWLADG